MPDAVVKYSCVRAGRWPTDWLTVTPLEPTTTVTLVIPGNPGLVGFYEQFCVELCEELHGTSAVWVVSHSCHSVSDPTPKSTVARETEHKVLFIKKYVPAGCKLRLIGHSIGCQMIIKALDDLTDESSNRLGFSLGQSYLLFPTIERMKDTPRGQVLWPILSYFWWLLPFLGSCFTILPQFIKVKVARIYLFDGSRTSPPDCVVVSVVLAARADLSRNSLDLAYDELVSVTEVDTRMISKYKNHLVFYYGASDGWCPLSFRDDLMKLVPGSVSYLCARGIHHAFMIRSSVLMAGELVNIIREVEELEQVQDSG